jgi:NAD(P)-dependent dehydrogenase (short-subunit alcohol dehydrogenase family)
VSIVFITGSTDGLGRAAAQSLLDNGHQVVLHARSADRARTIGEVASRAAVVIGDLRSAREVRSIADQVNAIGRMDAVIHDAGVYTEQSRGATAEGHAGTLAVNTLAAYMLSALIQRPDRLVYLSSGLHRGGEGSLGDLDWTKRPGHPRDSRRSDSGRRANQVETASTESAHIGDPYFATVSLAFVQDWLVSLRSHCSASQYAVFLEQAGFSGDMVGQAHARVTHDQIVKLYQVVAVGTGDEMMGLWSRPIRSGALKFICTTVIEASSIRTALYRFTRFWNLLLDDFRLQMIEDDETIRIELLPFADQTVPHRFGHMLLLKLTHGIVSRLAGRELSAAPRRVRLSEAVFCGGLSDPVSCLDQL